MNIACIAYYYCDDDNFYQDFETFYKKYYIDFVIKPIYESLSHFQTNNYYVTCHV